MYTGSLPYIYSPSLLLIYDTSSQHDTITPTLHLRLNHLPTFSSCPLFHLLSILQSSLVLLYTTSCMSCCNTPHTYIPEHMYHSHTPTSNVWTVARFSFTELIMSSSLRVSSSSCLSLKSLSVDLPSLTFLLPFLSLLMLSSCLAIHSHLHAAWSNSIHPDI